MDFFFFCCLWSCYGNKTTADLQKVYGQQMTLPEGGQWRVLNRDTTYIVGSDKPKIRRIAEMN
ncbi:hypothetical protein BN938_2678 [Mucinivorans hirudinis]|uniref:Uncharacterized protein n=1 Tax=Mucinivorans hirudinis TaxID=1433126 RepID=A0A060RAW9_9BACT|nr:hypothetical protein BN938_2678 [Mucinivorans hirudinis]